MHKPREYSSDFDFLPNHPAGVLAPQGWQAGLTYAGLKTYGEGKLDLGLLVSRVPCAVAGVYTTSLVKAAPVLLDAEITARGDGPGRYFQCRDRQRLHGRTRSARRAGYATAGGG